MSAGPSRRFQRESEDEGASSGRSEVEAARLRPLLALLDLLEDRYPDHVGHGELVGSYCVIIGKSLGMRRERVQSLLLAGTLHDLGKLVIDESVLRDPGPLDDDGWREVRRHPELGANLLAASNLGEVARWVLAHHERPDGRGYPFGIPDAEIPVEAKILAVADSYDAMRTERVYCEAMTHAEAVEELERNIGGQFDGEVVEAFVGSLDSLGVDDRDGAEAYSARS